MVASKTERWSRRLANLLLLALVVYFAWVLARMTWLVLWQDPVNTGVQAMDGATSQQDSQLMSQPLAAFDLFGRASRAEPVAESVRKSAPETRLRLRLEGVLVAERAEDSGAIVAGADGTTEHYRVGDTLPGNAELVEVEPQRILIKRNGLFETLTFEESEQELVTESEPVNTSSPDRFMADVQSRLDAQGAQALVAFGLRPVQDGSAPGYVFDGSNPMLRAASLKKGDIITAVNGQTLGNYQQDRALLDSWRSMSQVEIEIVRDGARFTVSYALPAQWR